MQHLVLALIAHEVHDFCEKQLNTIGFRKQVVSDDKRLAFHLPYPAYATMREGDSPEDIRNEVMSELACRDISAFVVVAQNFVCGRS